MKCARRVLRGFRLCRARELSQIAILATLMLAASVASMSALAQTSRPRAQSRPTRTPASTEGPVNLGVSSASPSATSSGASSGTSSGASSTTLVAPKLASLESEASLRARINRKSSDIDARIKLSVILEKKHNWNEVIEFLQSFISQLPRPSLLILAKAYEMKSDNLNEMRVLELCLAKDPKDFYCKTAQAQVLVRMKHMDDAITAFEAAKEMNPKFEPAYLGLLAQLEATEQNYEARSLLADMKKVFGDKPAYHSDNCRLLSKDAFLEKTVEACNEAIAVDTKNPLNYTYLATSLNEKEEPAKAVSLLQKGLKKFPKSDAILNSLGALEMEQKAYANAYRDYKAAIAANPRSLDGWTGCGAAALELQKYEESLKSFDQACAIDRHAVKAFRSASSKMRGLKDSSWQNKFEDHINMCSPQY